MSSSSAGHAGSAKGSIRSYLTGFVLAVVLTACAFGLVVSRAFSPTMTLAGIFAAAVIQMLVHLHYFLHLDFSSEQRWNSVAAACAIMIMVLLIGGSTWIMFNLHARTMDRSALTPTIVSRSIESA